MPGMREESWLRGRVNDYAGSSARKRRIRAHAQQLGTGLIRCTGDAAVDGLAADGRLSAGRLRRLGRFWSGPGFCRSGHGAVAGFRWVTDPLIGFLSDRIRTPWGRRKPFVVLGTPLYIAGIYLLFIPPIEFTEITFFGMTMNSGYPVDARSAGADLRRRHHQRCALQRLGRRAVPQLQRAHPDHQLARRLHGHRLADRRLHPGHHLSSSATTNPPTRSIFCRWRSPS